LNLHAPSNSMDLQIITTGSTLIDLTASSQQEKFRWLYELNQVKLSADQNRRPQSIMLLQEQHEQSGRKSNLARTNQLTALGMNDTLDYELLPEAERATKIIQEINNKPLVTAE
jgi:hypothetical protein